VAHATARSSSGRETAYAECGLRPVATVSGSAFISASSQTLSNARSATSGRKPIVSTKSLPRAPVSANTPTISAKLPGATMSPKAVVPRLSASLTPHTAAPRMPGRSRPSAMPASQGANSP
jgi:hypothetical protein